MTLPDYGWQIRGIPLGPTIDYLVLGVTGLGMTDVRASDTVRDQVDGDFLGVDTYSSRHVELTLLVRGADGAGANARYDALAAAWQMLNGETTLNLVSKIPGREECAYVGRPRRLSKDVRRMLGARINTVAEFYAPDPSCVSTAAYTSTSPVVSAQGRSYPRTYNLVYPAVVASGLWISNAGNWPATCQFRIVGPVTTPSLEIPALGMRLQFNVTLAAGDVLVADTATRSVTVNGAPRRAALSLDSRWPRFPPGSTPITFLGSSSTTATSCTATWRNTYAG